MGPSENKHSFCTPTSQLADRPSVFPAPVSKPAGSITVTASFRSSNKSKLAKARLVRGIEALKNDCVTLTQGDKRKHHRSQPMLTVSGFCPVNCGQHILAAFNT